MKPGIGSRLSANRTTAIPLRNPTTRRGAQDDDAKHDPSPGCLDASLRTKLQTERGGPRQKTRSHDRELVRPGSPPTLDVKCRYRLLAGGARIHVDFHADRHFDDFRCFPGHLALLLIPDGLRPQGVRYCGSKSSPAKSFSTGPGALCCIAKEFTVLCGRPGSKQRGIKRFAVAGSVANADLFIVGAVPAFDKELVRFV